MKAQETTVLRLLQGSKVFLIPNFQRRYAWRKGQWEELWDDVLREYETDHDEYSQELDGHFLGSVVLHPAPGPASTLMRHLVIDGQQRLTTLIVLLAAIRDFRADQDPAWNPASYDSKYLTNPFDEDYPDRLVPTEFDREDYISTVRHGRPSGGIGQAYTYFRDRLNEPINDKPVNLARLGDVILIHMLLVEINTAGGDSVNNIFNTLNSKGLPLSATDLVRNELLLNLGEDAAVDAYQNVWLPMERELVRTDRRGNTNDALFVTFFWAREVAHAPNATKKNLFPTFERRLRRLLDRVAPSEREAAVSDIFREIYSDYLLYRVVLDPTGVEVEGLSGDVRMALEELRSWGSEPYVPLALWFLRELSKERVSSDDAAKSLRLLLGYLVRRALFGLSSNNLSRLLSSVPDALQNRSDTTSAADALRTLLERQGYRWPTDAEVRGNIPTQPIYLSVKRGQTRFILETLERLRSGRELVDLSSTTLEHVMPQSLPEHWQEYLMAEGDELDDAEAAMHTLGNLTLSAYNSPLADKSFAEKRLIFETSPIRLNGELARETSWTVEKIRKRSEALGSALLAYLPGPSDGTRRSSDATDRNLRERITEALQSLQDGQWTSDDELMTLFAAERDEVRRALNSLGPELARLTRDEDGRVGKWVPASLAKRIVEQSVDQAVESDRVDAEAIAQAMRTDAEKDWEAALDDSSWSEATRSNVE